MAPRVLSDTEKKLRSIRPLRGRYTAEEVNAIREAYLLDGIPLPEIQKTLMTQTTINGLWRIAIGQSYPEVPLSERLLAAHRDNEARRRPLLPPQTQTAPRGVPGAPAWRS